jgi:uncharacterized protein with HEPN domain
MDKRDKAVLRKMAEEAAVIQDLIAGFDYESFAEDERTKRAVCMTLINIGEMVKLLTEDVKRINRAIPWKSIAGLRDVTARGYQTLRMEDIWETATVDIPVLQEQLRAMLLI